MQTIFKVFWRMLHPSVLNLPTKDGFISKPKGSAEHKMANKHNVLFGIRQARVGPVH